jgi:hypothetical protein
VTLGWNTSVYGLCGIVMIIMAALVAAEPSLLLATVAVPAGLVVALASWSALRGNRAATLALVFTAVFLIDIVFRVRDYQDKGVDFQVILKLALWGLIGLVALVHAGR